MSGIMVGDSVYCPACGLKVVATVDRFSNLTYLKGDKPCADGSDKHEWPDGRVIRLEGYSLWDARPIGRVD